MSPAAEDLWERAKDALRVAKHDLVLSADAAASRAYYAAFYAASALFAIEGKIFSKHSAVEAAVHRDLVQPGVWTAELGRGYSRLAQLRARGDYGGSRHVSAEDAAGAVQIASDILRAVAEAHPNQFDPSEET